MTLKIGRYTLIILVIIGLGGLLYRQLRSHERFNSNNTQPVSQGLTRDTIQAGLPCNYDAAGPENLDTHGLQCYFNDPSKGVVPEGQAYNGIWVKANVDDMNPSISESLGTGMATHTYTNKDLHFTFHYPSDNTVTPTYANGTQNLVGLEIVSKVNSYPVEIFVEEKWVRQQTIDSTNNNVSVSKLIDYVNHAGTVGQVLMYKPKSAYGQTGHYYDYFFDIPGTTKELFMQRGAFGDEAVRELFIDSLSFSSK